MFIDNLQPQQPMDMTYDTYFSFFVIDLSSLQSNYARDQLLEKLCWCLLLQRFPVFFSHHGKHGDLLNPRQASFVQHFRLHPLTIISRCRAPLPPFPVCFKNSGVEQGTRTLSYHVQFITCVSRCVTKPLEFQLLGSCMYSRNM